MIAPAMANSSKPPTTQPQRIFVVSGCTANVMKSLPICTSASGRNEAGIKEGEKERHHSVTEDQPREVTAEVCFGPPKRWHFIMDVMHQVSEPDEAKDEDKNPGCDESEEEFFPVHIIFLLRLLLSPAVTLKP